jgi:hypothetical protein
VIMTLPCEAAVVCSAGIVCLNPWSRARMTGRGAECRSISRCCHHRYKAMIELGGPCGAGLSLRAARNIELALLRRGGSQEMHCSVRNCFHQNILGNVLHRDYGCHRSAVMLA